MGVAFPRRRFRMADPAQWVLGRLIAAGLAMALAASAGAAGLTDEQVRQKIFAESIRAYAGACQNAQARLISN